MERSGNPATRPSLETGMPSSVASPGTSRWLGILRLLGYFVFLAAFFLPACREPGASDSFRGAFCAWVTIINTFNHEAWKTKDCLAILSGWINPLMLLYVACLFSRRLRALRLLLSSLIFLFMAGTWVYFYLAQIVPLIGHFLWITGILMILAAEITAGSKRADSAAPNSQMP
jgi:hypothetical protein